MNKDLISIAKLAGRLLSERRDLQQALSSLPHNDGTVSWALVMSIVMEAGADDAYNPDGSLKSGLCALVRGLRAPDGLAGPKQEQGLEPSAQAHPELQPVFRNVGTTIYPHNFPHPHCHGLGDE